LTSVFKIEANNQIRIINLRKVLFILTNQNSDGTYSLCFHEKAEGFPFLNVVFKSFDKLKSTVNEIYAVMAGDK
jgi:hypothetical protein